MFVLEALGDARDGRERGAEGEGDHDDAVDVDAHEPGGVGVLRDGLHAAAGAGAVDEEPQAGGAHDQAADGEQRGPLDGHAADLERRAGDDVDLRERDALLGVREVDERDVAVEEPDGLLEGDERPMAVMSGASRGACAAAGRRRAP